jgi:hypothetical protein
MMLAFPLSLAFMKRCAELSSQPPSPGRKAAGCGCWAVDLDLSPDLRRHYPDESVLYRIVPVVLHAVMRAWFLAQRRQMSRDLFAFSLRDRVSFHAAGVKALFLVVPPGCKPGPGL